MDQRANAPVLLKLVVEIDRLLGPQDVRLYAPLGENSQSLGANPEPLVNPRSEHDNLDVPIEQVLEIRRLDAGGVLRACFSPIPLPIFRRSRLRSPAMVCPRLEN